MKQIRLGAGNVPQQEVEIMRGLKKILGLQVFSVIDHPGVESLKFGQDAL